MRKCDICGTPMTSRETTPDAPYAYVLGGLPRVGLVGIIVHRCAACDVEAPVIPKIGELHRVLARGFVRKVGPLAGEELRFLRKHAGLSAQDFAHKMAIDPSHLSRVETGKVESLGVISDRLARAILAVAIDIELFKEFMDRLESEGKTLRKPLARFDPKKKKWHEERAA